MMLISCNGSSQASSWGPLKEKHKLNLAVLGQDMSASAPSCQQTSAPVSSEGEERVLIMMYKAAFLMHPGPAAHLYHLRKGKRR